MRDPVQTLANAITRDAGGIAIVWCPDLDLREWLVGEVESLVPEGTTVRVSDVEAAIAEPTRLALLVPENEREAVLDLDGSRDRLRSTDTPRSAPIVLFLLRDGEGQRAIAREAPSLASWARGNDADPEALAEIDAEKERAAFLTAAGESPEAWLAKWRGGTLEASSANFRCAYQAMLLERHEDVG
jgi:hypothetical protein